MNKKYRIGITAIIGIAITFLSLSCSPQGALAKAGAPSAGSLKEAPETGVPVRVASANVEAVENLITLSGEVSATGVVNVMPETSGLLTRILVNPGDWVAKDQVIAWVDPSRPGMAYAESPVKAKAAGTVTDVAAVAGNQVSPQTLIVQVGNLQRLEVDVRVPERYLGSLVPGMEGRITSRAFPDSMEPAQVSEVSPVVDPRSRTVTVTLSPNAGGTLRPGQSVTVDLILDSRLNVTTVPESAVVERSGDLGVFVVSGERAAWTPVIPGASFNGRTEVVEGLESDSDVVVAGADRITDGSLLKIIEG